MRYSLCMYRQVSKIRRTLEGNKIIDHSDVVGASPVGAAPTTSSFSIYLTPGLNGLGKGNCTMRRKSFKFLFRVRLMLHILRYVENYHSLYTKHKHGFYLLPHQLWSKWCTFINFEQVFGAVLKFNLYDRKEIICIVNVIHDTILSREEETSWFLRAVSTHVRDTVAP